jgi:hypothetical protein
MGNARVFRDLLRILAEAKFSISLEPDAVLPHLCYISAILIRDVYMWPTDNVLKQKVARSGTERKNEFVENVQLANAYLSAEMRASC